MDVSHKLIHAFNTIPFNRMLGLEIHDLGHDHVQLKFPMKEELVGNFLYGILHGGVTSSVLDMAGGMACMLGVMHKKSTLSEDEILKIISKCSTIDLQVSYINPGKGKFFMADAWLVKSGNSVSFARMELSNQDKTLIATATGTYLLR